MFNGRAIEYLRPRLLRTCGNLCGRILAEARATRLGGILAESRCVRCAAGNIRLAGFAVPSGGLFSKIRLPNPLA